MEGCKEREGMRLSLYYTWEKPCYSPAVFPRAIFNGGVQKPPRFKDLGKHKALGEAGRI